MVGGTIATRELSVLDLNFPISQRFRREWEKHKRDENHLSSLHRYLFYECWEYDKELEGRRRRLGRKGSREARQGSEKAEKKFTKWNYSLKDILFFFSFEQLNFSHNFLPFALADVLAFSPLKMFESEKLLNRTCLYENWQNPWFSTSKIDKFPPSLCNHWFRSQYRTRLSPS